MELCDVLERTAVALAGALCKVLREGEADSDKEPTELDEDVREADGENTVGETREEAETGADAE